MTKHSPLIDNLHWENGSGNGISLMFPDDSDDVHAFDSDDNLAFRSSNLCFKGQRDLNAAGFESNHGMLNS
jgi:hypothetical protein